MALSQQLNKNVKIIMSTSLVTCNLDPLQIELVKVCIDKLLPSLTSKVDASLPTSEVSPRLKQAVILSLLQIMSLDSD